MAFRMTRQRRIILDEVRAVKSHPTADEIYEQVRRRIPRISMGTVYRNLEFLADSGIIRRMVGNPMRFDGNTSPHYHVRCLGCRKVEDLAVELISQIQEELGRASDYLLVGYSLEATGYCPKCRENHRQETDPD